MKNQRGTALLLSILILSPVLAIALGVSTIMLKEIRFNRSAWFNLPAFFAADAGIEQILTVRDNPVALCTAAAPCTLSGGAKYWVVATATGSIKPDGTVCTSVNYCIESIGNYQGTRRAMEANY